MMFYRRFVSVSRFTAVYSIWTILAMCTRTSQEDQEVRALAQ